MHRPSRAKMGRHSKRRSAGDGRSWGVQKREMPMREKASSEASPDSTSKASRAQAAEEIGASMPSPFGLSRALSKVSLPIKPDSGGMPMISRAQAIKLK